MLVLSRKIGEAIVIDGGIVVRVADVHGGRVRLAIDAPRSTRVDREEVHDRVADAGFQPVADRRRPAAELPITISPPRRIVTVA
jgi:carbon storage regulator